MKEIVKINKITISNKGKIHKLMRLIIKVDKLFLSNSRSKIYRIYQEYRVLRTTCRPIKMAKG